jgi:putative nucleotidyltransferase with HDIG domain
MSNKPTRDDAVNLLFEYTSSPGLRGHAFAVAAAMKSYAERWGEDTQLWEVTGLLHDFDYERFQEFPDHPYKGNEILAQLGFPEEVKTAILGHVPATGVSRTSRMAKTLFACDELCGFIVACAMVRPNRLNDLLSGSVIKKMKDKAFARSVNREDIRKGAEELGLPLPDHIDFVIAALRGVSSEIGL